MNAIDLMCGATTQIIDRQRVQAVARHQIGIERLAQIRPTATRVIIPAAGLGTRFHSPVPKPIASGSVGRPLILRVLDAVAPFDPLPLIVVNASSGADIQRAVTDDGIHQPEWIIQGSPRGMGDAVLAASATLAGFTGDVLVAWADMGAVCTANIFQGLVLHQLARRPLTIISKRRPSPYVALIRSQTGELADVLLQREGAIMPEIGESDCGLFWFRVSDLVPALDELGRASRNSEVTLWPLLRQYAQAQRPGLAALLARPWQSQGVNTTDELASADAYMGLIYSQTSSDLASARTQQELADALTLATLGPAVRADVGAALAATHGERSGILHQIPPWTAGAITRLLSRSTPW